ncbi:MAG TPA: GAF domain-containing protein [Anaerolineales bacterium]|nr:GAF domain-containing protein [Anaerolineales bacterium]
MIEFNSPPQTKWMQASGVIGLLAAYLFFFPRLLQWVGVSALTLGILPAAIAGWYLGRRIALIVSAVIIFATAQFLSKTYPPFIQHWPDIALIVVLGFATGILRKTILERDRTAVELQKSLREERALTEIARVLSETQCHSLSQVLQIIVNSACELIPNTDKSVIHLFDEEEQALIPQAVSGYQEQGGPGRIKMGMGEGVAGKVIAERRVIRVDEVQTDPRFRPQNTPSTYRSLMVAPVENGQKCLGTISVQSGQPAAFSAEDEALLCALGAHAAIAIENARMFETIQQGYKEANALYHITREMASSQGTDQLIENVVNLLQQNFGYYYVQFLIVDPETKDLVVKEGSGELGKRLKGERFPAGTGIIGHVAVTGKTFFTNDVHHVVFFSPHPLLTEIQSELAVPVIVNGRVFGVLDVQQKPPHRLTERDEQLVHTVADQLAIALQKASLYAELQTSIAQEKSMRSQLIQSEKLALVERLLASISHELNNPLQAIQNALFLLKDDESLSPQGKQDLQIILSETERMSALLERLRASYRPTQMDKFQPVQLNTIIEDVYALLATHLRHKQVAFEFHPDPNLPFIAGLPDQLRQVVLNLLLNGVEAASTGGRLTVSTEITENQEALLTVSDTGPGIDPVLLPHIFDVFVTNKESGTGLGLAITQDIVQRHKGRIQAENNQAGGATFKVWLPILSTEQT